MGFLVDTGIWIDVEQGRLSPGDVASITKDEPVFISPITIAELQYGVEIAPKRFKSRRLAALIKLKQKPVLPIDEGTGEIFGSLAAELRNKRGHSFRIQDLWIASQAIQHGIMILTLNKKDFEDIPGLSRLIQTIKNNTA